MTISNDPTKTDAKVEMVEGDFTCQRCDKDFTGTMTLVEGKPLYRPALCATCFRMETPVESPPAKSEISHVMKRLGINVRKHGHLTLDEMEAGDAGVVQRCREFVQRAVDDDGLSHHLGLYLIGTTGVGKTQAAAATVREMLMQGVKPRDIVWDRARGLIAAIRDRYGTGTVEEYLATRRDARIWVLDDMGREAPGADAFRFIDDIFDAREGHLTLLTSNKTPDEMASFWAGEDFAGAFHSRIGPANFVLRRMMGRDRREK